MSEHLQLDTRSGRVKRTTSTVGTEPKPIDFSEVFVIGLHSGIGPGESGTTPLVNGQSYIDVAFVGAQTDLGWMLQGCSVINTVDANPLNIWPGIMTNKTTLGFRIQLNGKPDSANYYLRWCITGIIVEPVEATTYTLSGPSSGVSGVASTDFTVALPVGTTVSGTLTVTLHSLVGGTFTPPVSVALTTAAPSATFTYTPTTAGAKTISVTNNKGLTNPGNLTYTATSAGLADGDPVSAWADSSSGGHGASMTGSNRPVYKTAIVNSKPVVRFTTAGASKLNLGSTISGASAYCCLAVIKATGPTVAMYSISGGVGNGPWGPFENSTGDVYTSDRVNLNRSSGTNYTTAFHVFTTNTNGAGAVALFADGTNVGIGGTAFANSGDFSTLGYNLFGPGYSDGDIAEVVFYNVQLSPTDRANVEKYLATKYGLTVAGGTAVDPSTVTGLVGWWKADSGVT